MSNLELQKSVLTPTEFIEKEFEKNPVDILFDPSKIINFIELLYDKLRNNNICFLSGSFVFEDPNMKLFYTLCGFDKSKKTTLNLTRAGPFTKTHSVFFRNKNFKQLRSISNNVYLDDSFNSKVNTIKVVRKQFDLQYQRNIDKKLKYLCDTCCNSINKNNTNCDEEYCENNKEEKGAILFYPFRTVDQEDINNIRVKTYLFLKLEGFEALSLMHSVAALKRYILKIEKKQSHDVRREDDKESEHKEGLVKKTGQKLLKSLKFIATPLTLPLKLIGRPVKKFLTRKKKKTIKLNPEINIPNANNTIRNKIQSKQDKNKTKNKTKNETKTKTKKHKTKKHKTTGLPLPKSDIIKLHMGKNILSNENTAVLTQHVNGYLSKPNKRYLTYNEELLEKDKTFINNILQDSSDKDKAIATAMKNFNYYNEKIRSSKELFIPKEVTLKIVEEIKTTMDETTNTNSSQQNIIDLDETLKIEEGEKLTEIPFVLKVQKELSEQLGVQLSTTNRSLSVGLGIDMNDSISAVPIGTSGLLTPPRSIPRTASTVNTSTPYHNYHIGQNLERHFAQFGELPKIKITNNN